MFVVCRNCSTAIKVCCTITSGMVVYLKGAMNGQSMGKGGTKSGFLLSTLEAYPQVVDMRLSTKWALFLTKDKEKDQSGNTLAEPAHTTTPQTSQSIPIPAAVARPSSSRGIPPACDQPRCQNIELSVFKPGSSFQPRDAQSNQSLKAPTQARIRHERPE